MKGFYFIFKGCLSSLNLLGLDMAIKWKDVKEKVLQNPKVKSFYDELEPEFALAREIAKFGESNGLSQREFSEKAGIQQPQLDSLESENQSSRLATLDSSAGYSLEVRFLPDISSSEESISFRIDPTNIPGRKPAKKAGNSKKLVSSKSGSPASNKKHKSASKAKLTGHSC